MRILILFALVMACAHAADPAPTPALPTLLDLGSRQCISCKKMEPVLEALAKDFAGRLTVTFIDVNADPAGAAAAVKWQIELIPTQIFLSAEGKELFRHQGFYSREDILAKWQELGVNLGTTEPAMLKRLEPVTPDTRPAASVCHLCDRDLRPATQVTINAPAGAVPLCSPHCFAIYHSCSAEAAKLPAMTTVRTADGKDVPIVQAFFSMGVDQFHNTVVQAFSTREAAVGNGGMTLDFPAWLAREQAVRCGFCDRSVYPEDAAKVRVGGLHTWGCCAHCAMGVAARMRKDIVIDYPDNVTGEIITITTQDLKVASVTPATAVAWFGKRRTPRGSMSRPAASIRAILPTSRISKPGWRGARRRSASRSASSSPWTTSSSSRPSRSRRPARSASANLAEWRRKSMQRLRSVIAAILILVAVAGLRAWCWRTFLAPPAPEPVQTALVPAGRRPVVFYLHGTIRCVTCNTFHKAIEEALAAYTPPAGGVRPVLQVVNYQKPGNEHFARDFKVVASSVLLAEVDGERIVRGRLCPRIWDLSDRPALLAYLGDELRTFYATPGNPVPATVAAEPVRLGWWLALISAIGLGLLTAISPCPMATNIAAISFLARRTTSSRRAVAGGMAYALGRALVYLGLGVVLTGGLLSIPAVSQFLAVHVNAVLGPLLILVSVVLLRLVEMTWSLGGGGTAIQRWGERGGLLASFGIGILFALAFCPTSAALFFGALIPLAVSEGDAIALPAAYGLATALPVLVFAVLVVVAAQAAGRLFNRLSGIEAWMRWITGGVFLAVGLYYTIRIDLFPAT